MINNGNINQMVATCPQRILASVPVRSDNADITPEFQHGEGSKADRQPDLPDNFLPVSGLKILTI